MAIRPIEEEYTATSSARMWVKVLFLVLVVAGGMFFLSNGSMNTQSSKQVFNNDKASIKPTSAYSLKDVQSEGVKLANSTAEKAQQSIGDVLGEMTEDVTTQVEDKVEQIASESSQMLIDYAYKNTVLQFLKQMLDTLPERQQSEFQQMMCVDPALNESTTNAATEEAELTEESTQESELVEEEIVEESQVDETE